jgi:2',3'-cyclic-nucleotide 2'-phosphodiesterase (5'-nucleotidase family)
MKKYLQLKNLVATLTIALVLLSCAANSGGKSSLDLSNVNSQNMQIDSTLANDATLEAFIAPYRADLQKSMDVVIGHSAVDLTRGKPEAPLNNFVADLMLKRANAEFDKPVEISLTNLGGLRVDIPKGPVTVGKIYEVMPFENELVVLEMNGNQVLTLAKEIGEGGGEPIAGMRIDYQNGRLKKLSVGGKYIENDSLYYLVTTDYLSAPGRNRLGILGEVPRIFLGITLRDAILDEVKAIEKAGLQIDTKVDGRIVIGGE